MDIKPAAKKGYQVPWIEKFRPQLLKDVVGNEETLIRLQAIAEDGNLPNLILCGPPGTGKVRLLCCAVFCWNESIFLIHPMCCHF